MSGRDPRRPADPDDWFGEFFGGSSPRRSGSAVEPQAPASEEPGADDWLDREPDAGRPEESNDGFTIKLGTLLVAGAVIVVLLIVGGLALAGVFSGGSKHPPTSPTTAPTVTTTPTTPTTTATTTTPSTPSALRAPASTLKPGDQGAQVKLLQRALARLGYATGAVDGDYGPSTKAALTRFQTAAKLTADGVLGPQTLQALKLALQRKG
jgi:hypothetical protein